MPERIEHWMMEETRRFLERSFLEVIVDYYPRGANSAALFRVEGKTHTGERKLLHQLWIDKSFYGRCPERSALKSALEGSDVAMTMKKAGDKIVELH